MEDEWWNGRDISHEELEEFMSERLEDLRERSELGRVLSVWLGNGLSSTGERGSLTY